MNTYSMKNILLGIGVGLILAAIIGINTSSRELTVEQLRQQARLHNMELVDAGQTINNAVTPSPVPTATIKPEATPKAQ